MTTTSISELVKQIRAFDRWDGHNYERGFGTAQHCQLPFEAADALESLARSIPTAVERDVAVPVEARTDFTINAESIVNSERVINTYASCEWDDLHDDGKLWIEAIVRETEAHTVGGVAEWLRGQAAIYNDQNPDLAALPEWALAQKWANAIEHCAIAALTASIPDAAPERCECKSDAFAEMHGGGYRCINCKRTYTVKGDRV